jgi:hypothetical protein
MMGWSRGPEMGDLPCQNRRRRKNGFHQRYGAFMGLGMVISPSSPKKMEGIGRAGGRFWKLKTNH